MGKVLNFSDFMNESSNRFCNDCSLPIIDSDFKNDYERQASEDEGGLCRKCLIERDPFIEDAENFTPHETDEMEYAEAIEYLLNDEAVAKGEEILNKAITLPPTENNMFETYNKISKWENDHSLFIDGSLRFRVSMKTIYLESKPQSWKPNVNLPDKFKGIANLYEKYLDHYRDVLPGPHNPNSKSIKNKMDKIDFENENKRSLTDEEWERMISQAENDLRSLISGLSSKEEYDYPSSKKSEQDLSPSEIDELIDQALDDKDFKEVERLANLKEEILGKISKGRR